LPPAGTAGPILARLRDETNKLLADAQFRQRIANVGGLQPYVTTPEEFAAQLRAEYAKYGDIVKAAGVKLD
jgi:tripartite-type tricarboxylate transporter receptor subunit TctC